MPTKTAQRNGAAEQSLEDLLDALLNKTATDINPPTDGPGAGKPETEEIPVEGARSAENDAFIRETLGQTGAESTISPDTYTGQMNLPSVAAPKLPTGEDPANESHGTGTPPNLDQGTSLVGATLAEKEASLKSQIEAWRKTSAEIVREITGEAMETSAEGKTAEAADAAKQAQEEKPLTDEEQKIQQLTKEAVQNKLAEAHLEGRKVARITLSFLERLNKAAMDEQAMMAGGGDPAMMAGGGDPAAAMAMGDPSAAAGGAPPAAGGDTAAMMQDPQLIEQALVELASQMGMQPEELIAAIEEMLASQGGAAAGGGGAPPPPEATPAAEAGPPAEDGLPAEAKEEEASPEEKTAALHRKYPDMVKVAVAKAAVKKQARLLLQELATRGQRR